MTNTNIKILTYTESEFGLMSEVWKQLIYAKTRKEYNSSLSQITSFIRSISSVRGIYLPKKLQIISIDKRAGLQDFPADVHYAVSFISLDKN